VKSVIHIFHDDADSLTTGSRLPMRMHEIADSHGIEIEVFVFGPAQRKLTSPQGDAEVTFNQQIDALVSAGVTVRTCINSARAAGAEEQLRERGIALSVARDDMIRFTLEQATVITF
jgi:hypothetical protein